MQELLDLHTLAVNNMLVSLACGVCLTLYSNQYPQFKGINILGYALIVMSSAFLLLGLQNYRVSFLSIIIPNTLLVMSLALIHIGFMLFYKFNIELMKRLHLFLLVSMLVLGSVFTYLDDNAPARIFLISAISSIQCILIMRSLLQTHQYDHHKASFMIAVSFLFYATFFAFRALITQVEKPEDGFMYIGLLESITIIVYQFVVITTSFGFVWIISHKIHKILKDQATLDPLTGVFNRRALEEIINVEHSRSLRKQSPLAVIMLDIDFFKLFNDRHGHCVGDQVLVLVADILVKNTRGYDSIARYGGEEFIVLLPNTKITKAKVIAEKLRDKIAHHDYRIKENIKVEITASFGVTSCDLADEDWLEVLDRCDRALYLAKESGRNKVIILNDEIRNADSVNAG